MIIPFYKYHGTGNDFICIDNRMNFFKPDKNHIANLCNRKLGIGADGLILLENKTAYDFDMVYYNSNGAEGTMCGNGGRCIVAFANHLNIIKNKTIFWAIDGEHKAEIIYNSNKLFSVSLRMQDVQKIIIEKDFYFIDTGSPHYIKFVNNVDMTDVYNQGKKIRNSERFQPEGTNVDFVEIQHDNLYVRTYERGVENETLSCGTGVTAAAIAAAMKLKTSNNFFKIKTKGGDLKIIFKKNNNIFTNIRLEGPAMFVFKGEIII